MYSRRRQRLIRALDISHHYGIRPVLKRLTLEVKTGELVAVMGPNGMGKSTLLGVLAGTLAPQRGTVEIDGLRRRASEAVEWEIRKRVVYLPDHPWLPMGQTGREYLLAVGGLYGIEGEILIDHAERLLVLFDLQTVGDSPIRTYSNGQKKKIAIAGALVSEAPVMLLDEPFTGGLDPSAVVALKRVLERLAQRGSVTIVWATQLADIAEILAQRVAVLRGGELIDYDTVQALRDKTQCERLEEALETLIHPRTLERIDAYFGESS